MIPRLNQFIDAIAKSRAGVCKKYKIKGGASILELRTGPLRFLQWNIKGKKRYVRFPSRKGWYS